MFIALQSPKVINVYFRTRLMIPAGYQASNNVLIEFIFIYNFYIINCQGNVLRFVITYLMFF